MLPVMEGGHRGSRRGPASTEKSPKANSPNAIRTQARPAAKSRIRLSAQWAMNWSSAGVSTDRLTGTVTSAATTPGGKSSDSSTDNRAGLPASGAASDTFLTLWLHPATQAPLHHQRKRLDGVAQRAVPRDGRMQSHTLEPVIDP